MRGFVRLMEGLEQRFLMARPTGIDVSHWQGTINWASVAANNPEIEFAWTKATEGVDFNDDRYQSYVSGAAANGIPLTGYHFARYDNNPDATLEAQHYLDVVGPHLTEGRMPPMLDVEHTETLTKAQLSAWVNTWCNYVLNA